MIGIYKITSPKNRVYIGQSKDIERRFYLYSLMMCKGQTRLYSSFLKYGVEKHNFEIIEECYIGLLNERERYWQDYYNVISLDGLNCHLVKTNYKKFVHSEKTKLKISNSNKGKKRTLEFRNRIIEKMNNLSAETRFKMSESAKIKIFTDKHKENISKSNLGKTQKRFNVLNLESGIFHESIPKAAETYGYRYSYLKAMLLGQLKNKTNLIYIK